VAFTISELRIIPKFVFIFRGKVLTIGIIPQERAIVNSCFEIFLKFLQKMFKKGVFCLTFGNFGNFYNSGKSE
jgi:hypothetical protein